MTNHPIQTFDELREKILELCRAVTDNAASAAENAVVATEIARELVEMNNSAKRERPPSGHSNGLKDEKLTCIIAGK